MEDTKHKYVKRTKCDYSMSFKLAVIQNLCRNKRNTATKIPPIPYFRQIIRIAGTWRAMPDIIFQQNEQKILGKNGRGFNA